MTKDQARELLSGKANQDAVVEVLLMGARALAQMDAEDVLACYRQLAGSDQ